MQEVMLGATEDAGAEVRRGVTVTEACPGRPPQVVVRSNGVSETLETRLVVGADGRNSKMRAWGHFDVIRDPERMFVAGLLLNDVAAPSDAIHVFRRSSDGLGALFFPIDKGRMRTYFIYRKQRERRGLSGAARVPAFFDACVEVGVPREWFAGASAAGPLAEFDAADSWVRHPYREGVALVGDAASSNDPSWGNGLSLAIRDVRVLKESLLVNDDWDVAGRAYADTHAEYFDSVNRLTRWLTELMYEIGPEAEARRARALPLLAQDPSRGPDYISLGPDSPSDESVRQRLFGEV
jgi:2-polyprenyl-6-methoxyphenol hydroxylase-like FAD-dependent oxidoreductase